MDFLLILTVGFPWRKGTATKKWDNFEIKMWFLYGFRFLLRCSEKEVSLDTLKVFVKISPLYWCWQPSTNKRLIWATMGVWLESKVKPVPRWLMSTFSIMPGKYVASLGSSPGRGRKCFPGSFIKHCRTYLGFSNVIKKMLVDVTLLCWSKVAVGSYKFKK